MDGKGQASQYRGRQGLAVVSALAIAALLALLLAGGAIYVMGHQVRAQRELDYSAALLLAEAGVNHELRYISSNLTQPSGPRSSPPSSPSVVSVLGDTGSFEVYTTPIETRPGVPTAPGGSFTRPNTKIQIVSVGRMNGVARAIQITGVQKSIFDQFSIFGTDTVTFNGSGSGLVGSLGTNGVFTSSSGGAASVSGGIVYAGPNARGPEGTRVTRESEPIPWPTVDQVVATTFTNGWNTITTSNNNGNIRQFRSVNGSLTVAGTEPAGYLTGSSGFRLRNSDMNRYNSWPNNYSFQGQSYSGANTLIFPPGDYYFTDIQLSGNRLLVMDTAGLTTGTPGPVRIWMNSTSSRDSQDTLNMDVLYTSFDPSDTNNDRLKFRIYYNKRSEISIGGNTDFHGGFYGVRGDGEARIRVTGGSTVFGSVIANDVTVSGGTTVEYLLDGTIGSPNDFGMWYGFKEQWKEIPVTAGSTVYPDGTDF